MAILKSKSGSSFNTSTGVKTSSSGATTQVRSAKPTQSAGQSRSDYLKSLNKKGSSNYISTPDDAGMANMDMEQNAKAIAEVQAPITPETINTAQPSPTTVEAGQGLPGQPFDQALKGLGAGASKEQIGSLAQKYQTGLATTAGTTPPATMGQASPTIQNTVPKEVSEDMSLIDQTLSEDKGFQNLLTQYNEIFSPENQKSSLMDTYNKLYKDSGLDQLDEEIIDAKTIIEGTEDDIRSEIEQAGGFGTDSQVQALSLSRNKVLLKNYNNLVALRESKSNQLDTMMDFTDKDRTYAGDQLDRAIKFQDSILSYREKFVQNARDQYNKYSPQQLQAMLAGNPRQLAFAEQIMGVGPGGLEKLANAPKTEDELLDLEYKKGQIALQKSNLATDSLQRSKLSSEIKALNTPIDSGGLTTAQGKPMNVEQSKAYGFGTRTLQSGKVISDLENTFAKEPSSLKLFGVDLYHNAIKSEDAQKFEQAKRNFINAVLRRESGASISPSEFENAEKQYFPRLGDKPENLAQKKENRMLVIKNLLQESGIDVGDVSTLTLSPSGDLIRIKD